MLIKNKEPQIYDYGELNSIIAKIAIRSGHSYWKNRYNPVECAWVSGAVLLIEKEIFELVGGFNDIFYTKRKRIYV